MDGGSAFKGSSGFVRNDSGLEIDVAMTEPFVEFRCECGHQFRTHSQNKGKRIVCPNCLTPTVVPGQESSDSVLPRRNDMTVFIAEVDDFSELPQAGPNLADLVKAVPPKPVPAPISKHSPAPSAKPKVRP